MAIDTTRRTRATEGRAPAMTGDLDSFRDDLIATAHEHRVGLKSLTITEDFEKGTRSFTVKTIPAALEVQGELFERDGDE
jgi:hypothetical protein